MELRGGGRGTAGGGVCQSFWGSLAGGPFLSSDWRLWPPGPGSFINRLRNLGTSLPLLGLSFAFGNVGDQIRWP